jgi:hypothetical protein
MPTGVRNERALELAIRAAEAEERLLGRRLERLAADQQRARRRIERDLRAEHFGKLPDGWNERDVAGSARPGGGTPGPARPVGGDAADRQAAGSSAR